MQRWKNWHKIGRNCGGCCTLQYPRSWISHRMECGWSSGHRKLWHLQGRSEFAETVLPTISRLHLIASTKSRWFKYLLDQRWGLFQRHSPKLAFCLTSLRVQKYPNFLTHLNPGSMPHLKTLIIGTLVSIQDEMISHIPRSVTQLFIKALSPLTTGCIQHLPMNLKHLKIYGGHLKSERILLEQKEFRIAQTKQSE